MEKQDPTITNGSTNNAISNALTQLRERWRVYVEQWEGTT
jgi:hypothetical protein